jgi:hypothetical protein
MLRNSDDWRLISLVEREANGYNRREGPYSLSYLCIGYPKALSFEQKGRSW